LRNNVVKEFFGNTDVLPSATLSYWPPNTKELATGLTTPPVMLTNDGSVSYFYRHFEAHSGMNMFVTFEIQSVGQQGSQVDDNHVPFTTPNQPIKNSYNTLPSSTGASKMPGFSLFDDDDLLEDMPTRPAPQHSSPLTAPAKVHRFS